MLHSKMKNIYQIFFVIIVFFVGVVYGIFIHKYEVFPYKLIKNIYDKVYDKERAYRTKGQKQTYGPWSIGIYKGDSPFNFTDPEDIANPVLTGKDVSDIDAVFVADPFIVIKDGMYYMYFEVWNRQTMQGDIGFAESLDGRHWKYKKIVIDEQFHLSYPYIFKWNNDYYLIPESCRDLSVRLYKAVLFPGKWEYVGNLLTGHHYIDPTIFFYKGKWWLFLSTLDNNALNLYYSSCLLGEWKSHPMNPVKLDKNNARCAGRVVVYNNRIYRMAQDDEPYYGIQVFAFEIIDLSETSYSERLVSKKPLVKNTGVGWNAAGMHHVDLHKLNVEWIAAVDGKNK